MSGWGYAIDYDRAIREDEARIAHLTSDACILAARDLLPEAQAAHPQNWCWDVYSLITYKPDGIATRAAVFGLTLADVRAWAYFVDESSKAIWDVLGDDQKGDHAIGKQVDARLGHDVFDVLTEDQRRKALSKARAALGRHTRNKRIYG